MATTVLEIRVFAMFPLDPTSTEHPGWSWVHCLTFPLDILSKLQFSKSYKWIRYAIGAVVGVQGDLSFRRDSPHDIIDYDHDLPYESAELYYHTSHAEKEKMFPADPDMGRTIITSSSDTSRRADFRSDVIQRDRACVLTDCEECYTDAVHLLPHSKGGKYIENYTRRRSRAPAPHETDIVYDIDDSRNGILLNFLAHRTFGTNLAFLMTPNFAMTTTDVDCRGAAPPTEKRCTAHFFVPTQPQPEVLGDRALRSGHPVRMSDAADKWPPNILFDAVYANAVLHHFATQTMRDTLAWWKSSYYPSETISAARTSQPSITDEQTTKNERRNEQNRARDHRIARRAKRAADDCVDFYDCLLILPYLMVPPDKQDEVWRKAVEKSAEGERRRVENKVVGWARDVANACP